MNTDDFQTMATVSAIIAAYLTVFKNLKIINNKYLPLVGLVIATAFVEAPTWIYGDMVMISSIGLMAAGVYHTTKNKDGVK